MKSMTGYGVASGSSSVSNQSLEINVSFRSVNGRYLELRFHGPRHYTPFENEIKKRVTRKIQRGTVDIYIHRLSPASAPKVTVDISAVQEWVKAYKKLAKHLKQSPEIDLKTVARQSGVLQSVERNHVSAAEKKLLMDTVERALEKCNGAREREGRLLEVEIKKYLKNLGQVLRKVEGLKKTTEALLKQKYEKRVKKLGEEGLEPQRFHQELVFYWISRTLVKKL